jgi:Tol biopolymer transport system component
VVYWSNAEGIYQLWKINMDGTNRVRLTTDDFNALDPTDQNLLINDSPAWTPDGKRIAYSLAGDLWAMDSDGFNPETLLTGHKAHCPFYSPDGKSIYFISAGDDSVYNLWTMSLSEREPKKVTSFTDWNIGSPSFSSDGKKIIYNLYRENQTQVYTANPDGSDPLAVTNSPSNNSHSLCPRFLQGDRKIVYCTYGTGEDVSLTIYIANANGSDPKTLVKEASSPSWATAPIQANNALAPLPQTTPTRTTQPSSGLPQIGLPTPVGK